jgi:hypothetical protein
MTELKSNKKHLNIDLVSVNCLTPEESIKSLNYCSKYFSFNNSILFTSEKISNKNHEIINIEKFKDINDYSDFILNIGRFIKSDHVLIIQDDGHIVNPDKWDSSFLNYDYVGAPWPSNYKWRKRWKRANYQDAYKNAKKNRVGNGGFSLRSKKFLNYSSQFASCNGIAEDVFLCLVNYENAVEYGIKFAPFEVAYQFSLEVSLKGKNYRKESTDSIFNTENHFGWHGKRFSNKDYLLNLKNNIID